MESPALTRSFHPTPASRQGADKPFLRQRMGWAMLVGALYLFLINPDHGGFDAPGMAPFTPLILMALPLLFSVRQGPLGRALARLDSRMHKDMEQGDQKALAGRGVDVLSMLPFAILLYMLFVFVSFFLGLETAIDRYPPPVSLCLMAVYALGAVLFYPRMLRYFRILLAP